MTTAQPKPVLRIIDLTEDEFRHANDESMGYCLACGEEAYGVEPDARKYECESCEKPRVYGASELLLMGRINIVENPTT